MYETPTLFNIRKPPSNVDYWLWVMLFDREFWTFLVCRVKPTIIRSCWEWVYLYGFVPACSCQPGMFWMPITCKYRSTVCCELVSTLISSSNVPLLNCSIFRHWGKGMWGVRVELNISHTLCVTLKYLCTVLTSNIKQPHCPILRAWNEMFWIFNNFNGLDNKQVSVGT